MRLAIAACLLFLPLLSFGQCSLHVVLLPEKPALGGTLRVSLFPSRKSYISNEHLVERTVPVHGSTASCNFDSLNAGPYAIKVFQDMNGNGTLDKSWLGWPKEPVGYSNDAPINMGEPPFKLVVLMLEPGKRTERIRVR
ncbi:MAG: DUF2141 domain-containing protein [Bacteroidetes bacterium]|nr:DUF2141 domain-containing protein [Bacteroidota bacterium]